MASLLFPLQITHLFFAFPLPSYHLVVMFIDVVYLSFDIFITSERSSCIFSEAYLNLTSCHSLSFQSCSGARDKVSGALLSNTPPDLYLVWCTVWLGFIKSRSVWREVSVFPESTATSYNTSQINQRQLLWRIALKYFSRFSIVYCLAWFLKVNVGLKKENSGLLESFGTATVLHTGSICFFPPRKNKQQQQKNNISC